VVGVVVAGGRGARLGQGIPKALVRVGGITLLERAQALLRECCDEVLVAAPAALDLPVPDHLRIADAPGLLGPLGGVVAALGARPDREAFVLGVDFPLVRPATIAAIRRSRGEEPAAIPVPGGVPQPLVAAYGPGVGATLAGRATQDLAITRAVLALGPRLVDASELQLWEGGEAVFLNVNTRADLEEAERRLRTIEPRTGTGRPDDRVSS
jgi:molybdopterin-guanine dinucleotide biosynthesis protein A